MGEHCKSRHFPMVEVLVQQDQVRVALEESAIASTENYIAEKLQNPL